MSWLDIQGHDEVVEKFRRAITAGRLASTFLFVGEEGIGKRVFALRLAQTLFCPLRPAEKMNPCGVCPSCRQVIAEKHPDLLTVSKPEDRSDLPLGLLIGDGDRRNREGLCHDLALRPYMADRRFAIIDDADALNPEGANSLLKTLEEPPPGAVIVLIGTILERQLPTIRSRAQLVRFHPLAEDVVAQLLISTGQCSEEAEARRLAKLSGGSIQQAIRWREPELIELASAIARWLESNRRQAGDLAALVSKYAEAGGKEAAVRRSRIRLAVRLTNERMAQRWKDSLTGSSAQATLLEKAVVRGQDALWQVDRNAHQATLIESWSDDVARLLALR